jgi:hypothetical protein
MSGPRILNARQVGRSRPGAVYVGRPSPFGNPFEIGRDGTRDEVIAKHIEWLRERPEMVERARRELAGQDLICWCAPARCHAEVLRDLAMGHDLPDPPDAPPQGDLFNL